MSHTRMITSVFHFWSYLPFLCLNLIFCLCSVTRIPYGNFDDAWYKCRTGRDDMLRSRMTTVAGSCVCVGVGGWRRGGGGGGAGGGMCFSKNLF